MKNIGESIRQRRKELGMSQKELAQQVQTTQAHISTWESGKQHPTIDSMKKLAEALETTVDTLAGELSLLHGADLDELELSLINALRLLPDEIRERFIDGMLIMLGEK